jgi:hypothetical protein
VNDTQNPTPLHVWLMRRCDEWIESLLMRLETDAALRNRMRRHLECEEYEAAARVKQEQDRRAHP